MIPPTSLLWRLDMLGELRLVRLGAPDAAAPDAAAPDAAAPDAAAPDAAAPDAAAPDAAAPDAAAPDAAAPDAAAPDAAAPDAAAHDAARSRLRSRKTAGLLAFLTLRRGMHRRGMLAEMFWPDADSHGARGSLRVALSSLRALLEPAGIAHSAVLLVAGDSVGIGPTLGSDVEEFRNQLKIASAAPDATQKHAALHRALEWYRGPLVRVDEVEGWLAQADDLEEDFVRAQSVLLSGLEARGELALALELARVGAKKAPWHEAVALDLLRLAARENRSDAVRDFKKWCARAPKNGVSVSPATLQRAREWERGGIGTRGGVGERGGIGAREMASTPGTTQIKGLGGSGTSFFGREAEIDRLGVALSGGMRLITLTGAAGVGKTRLAEQVARRLALQARFGLIVWVTLAGLPVASLLAGAVAQSLGLSPRAANAPDAVAALEHALEQALRANRTADGTRVLLVLDGFEHLCDDGAPLVRAWLDAMPAMICLITSRCALGLAGEALHEVLPLETAVVAKGEVSSRETWSATGSPATRSVAAESLAAESAETQSPAAELVGQPPHSQAPAGRSPFFRRTAQQSSLESVAEMLFLARGESSRPAWRPSPEDRSAIAQLCAALEGLPLAIEIAAARLSWLSPAQLMAEIETSPEALAGGEVDLSGVLEWTHPDHAALPHRATPPHHATLRAALAWTERRLPLAVAHFWAQISVFRGGFTPEAASQVCGCEAAALIIALADMSLLHSDSHRSDSHRPDSRATQLEIARQYAAQNLSEAERAALEEKHARYFADWLLSRPALERLEAERWNLNRAHLWFARHEPSREAVFEASRKRSLAP